MAWGYYLNLEKLTLEIINENINLLPDDNHLADDTVFYDDAVFIESLKKGFIITTMLCAFIESALNNIMINIIGYNNDLLLKCSVDEKLEIIYLYFRKDLNALKSKNEYSRLKKITKTRNYLVHFKQNDIGTSSGTPSIQIGDISLAELFTKKEMVKYLDAITKFIEIIASDIEIQIIYDCEIIDCDGRDDYCTFFHLKEK